MGIIMDLGVGALSRTGCKELSNSFPGPAARLPEARGDLWRIVCWLLGHRWHVVSVNGRKASALVHLHTMAGSAAACDRCGELWDDR